MGQVPASPGSQPNMRLVAAVGARVGGRLVGGARVGVGLGLVDRPGVEVEGDALAGEEQERGGGEANPGHDEPG
jgi:hypothetical protein